MFGRQRAIRLVLITLALCVSGKAPHAYSEKLLMPVDLIPIPRMVEMQDGRFTLLPGATVSAPKSLAAAPLSLRLLLSSATGYPFPDAEKGVEASIRFFHEPSMRPEAYRLSVTADYIKIEALDDAGAYYALQTLRQLFSPDIFGLSVIERRWSLPTITVEDEPRFSWRGLHLDVGRHFMPVSFVKKYIDLLSAHKMNRFHWHLTEDQGWRIEIKRYPKLTSVGSRRAQTVVGNALFSDQPHVFDGVPHGGFYTQEEVREVVAYAAARHVTVVPEIEFPGHAQAAIAAYPELGNTGEQLKVRETWGISKNTLKPSPETLTFYRNVLSEVIDLFPSPYIHIGGDEAPKDQWEESEYAQQRMRELGLADTRELQSWMIRQMDEFLSANGRTLIGWDEIMQGGLSGNATVMSWRGMQPGARAAAAGHDVIMAPVTHTYFDYYQAAAAGEPLAIGFYLPLEQVYRFDPIPKGLPAQQQGHILGGQGQLWTEYMKTPEHVEYMAYPRAIALAEVLWSSPDQRDYDDFRGRLQGHLARLDVLDVNYRPPGNDGLTLWGRIKQVFVKLGMRLYFWWNE